MLKPFPAAAPRRTSCTGGGERRGRRADLPLAVGGPRALNTPSSRGGRGGWTVRFSPAPLRAPKIFPIWD